MFVVRKKYRFELAHQLQNAATACCHETIHGHGYVAEVFVRSEELNDNGMVVDFGAMDVIKKFIELLDHSLIVPDTFPAEYVEALKAYNKKCYVMSFNPTAEKLAVYMFNEMRHVRFADNRSARVYRVRLHETDSGYAEAGE